MTVTISTLAQNTIGAALADLVGAGDAVLEVYAGTRPATPNEVATTTKLAELVFSEPAFQAFVAGKAIANLITSGTAIATDTARWFRISNKDGDAILDGEVTVVGGGGDLELDNVDVVVGGLVTITSLQLVVPRSL